MTHGTAWWAARTVVPRKVVQILAACLCCFPALGQQGKPLKLAWARGWKPRQTREMCVALVQHPWGAHVPRLWRLLVVCSLMESIKSVCSSVPGFFCSLILDSFETGSLSPCNDVCGAWSHFATEHAEGFSQTELVPWRLLTCEHSWGFAALR